MIDRAKIAAAFRQHGACTVRVSKEDLRADEGQAFYNAMPEPVAVTRTEVDGDYWILDVRPLTIAEQLERRA